MLYLINVNLKHIFPTIFIVICFTCLTLRSKLLFYKVNVSLREKSTNFKRYLVSYWIGEKVVGSTSAVRDLHSKVKNFMYWAPFNKGESKALSPHVRGSVKIMVNWLNLPFPNSLNFSCYKLRQVTLWSLLMFLLSIVQVEHIVHAAKSTFNRSIDQAHQHGPLMLFHRWTLR